MQNTLGWLILIPGGLLYLGQVISSLNFDLAQRLGIQETPEQTDSVVQTAERYVAYWDLVTLGWLPFAGILMIMDHAWWPIAALLGGAIYFDTSGREAAKIISLRKEGFRLGSQAQQRLFMSTYILMAIIGLVIVAYAISTLAVG